MIECTFGINTKDQNTILTDERALAIRISNLLLNRKTGLPNNENVFYDIKSHSYEFASQGNLLALKEDITATIKQYIPSNMAVVVDVAKDGNKSDIRKSIFITITVGNRNGGISMVFKANSTADGLKLDKVVNL